MAFRDVYTFGPTFRAEKSYTPRHAAEFWMVEPEIAFADLFDDMALAEDMLKYVISGVLAKAPQEMAFLNSFVEKGLIDRLNAIEMCIRDRCDAGALPHVRRGHGDGLPGPLLFRRARRASGLLRKRVRPARRSRVLSPAALRGRADGGGGRRPSQALFSGPPLYRRRRNPMTFDTIVTDLDDTLLDGSGRLSAYTIEVMAEVKRRGIRLIPCSGRTHASMYPFLAKLDTGLPYIGGNGSEIVGADHRLIEQLTLDVELAREICAFLEQNGLYVQVYTDEAFYYSAECDIARRCV